MTKQKTGNYIVTGTINIRPNCAGVCYRAPTISAGIVPVAQASKSFIKFATSCKKAEKIIKEAGERSQMKKKKPLNSGTLTDEHPLKRLFAMIFLFKCELQTFQENPCYCGSNDLTRITETLEELGFDITASTEWLKHRGVYCDCNGRYYIEDEWGWAE